MRKLKKDTRTTILSIRIPEDDLARVQKIAEDAGADTSTYVRMLIKKAIKGNNK